MIQGWDNVSRLYVELSAGCCAFIFKDLYMEKAIPFFLF